MPGPDRTAARREALRRTLADDEVRAILVSAEPNVGYLTGFSGDSSYLLLSESRAIIVSDGRYTTQLARECPGLEVHIRPPGRAIHEAVAEVAGGLGLTRLAFEAARMTVAEREDLGAKLTAELKPVRGRVEALRAVKDDEEVGEIRRAIEVAEAAFLERRAAFDPDQTEKAFADELEAAMRRRGATAASFPPIVAAGENAAQPHYRPGDATRLGEADFVLVDWGASGRPYKSDLTRMLVTGKVASRFEAVYRIVLAAQERALASIRPGAKATDVDAEARAVIDEAGFGPFFDHGLGHGIGREIHEDPRLRPGSETILAPGMVVTVEPGIYLPGWGGIRIEDDVLVTPDGREVLTRLPKAIDASRTA